jgi:hypothetical protein
MNLQKIVKSQKYRHNRKIGIRSIEVFFKVCKSYLNLGKEFQGLFYDSMISHTSIVMVRYMMLAVENRNNQDSHTMGELFLTDD